MIRISSFAGVAMLTAGCVLQPVTLAESPPPPPAQPTVVPAADPTPEAVAEVTIPALDEWTDRYADGKKGDVRFFNLTKLMSKYGLSRLQALGA